MQGLRSFSCRAMLGLAALALPALASGQTHYRVTGLGGSGTDNGGHIQSYAFGINNAGMIVGQVYAYDLSHTSLGTPGFVWSNGTMTLLPAQGTDNNGASNMRPFAVSNAATLMYVGTFQAYDSSHNVQGNNGFTQMDTTFSDLGNNADPRAINVNGDVAGTQPLPNGALGRGAFRTISGITTFVPNFGTAGNGYAVSEGYGMNDNGVVVGMANVYDGIHATQGSEAFSWDGTTVTNLGNLGTDSNGYPSASAYGVNNAGQICGQSSVYNSSHIYGGDGSFLYSNGVMTDMGGFGTDGSGAYYTYAYAINNAGDVVGSAYVYDSSHNYVDYHAFLYHNGRLIDLNDLIPAGSGWDLQEARSINDKGQIVGYGIHNGDNEAFVLDSTPAGDFDGDGHADLLWQNPADGHTNVWLMNNLTYVDGVEATLPPLSTDWHAVGTPDFNGDGHTDLLWQNSTTGDLGYWLLDGGYVQAADTFATGIGSDWSVVGTADMNNDGHPDIIWWNATTGEAAVWYMNGFYVQDSASLASGVTGWTLQGVMPHTSDSNVTLLWRNSSTGDLGYWTMSNTFVQATGLVALAVPADWQVSGFADMDGDGQPDILWQNQTTGEACVWYMSGNVFLNGSAFSGTNGTTWKLVGPR